jgi:glycosyltransferase involved in cell wall biosynthesis
MTTGSSSKSSHADPVQARVDLSIVAPAFDEVENLVQLHAEISDARAGLECLWELILVDDHSTDDSPRRMAELSDGDPHVRVVRLGGPETAPEGQSAALAAGFDAARGDMIATIDADLQNDARDLPRMIEALSDYDLVAGIRVDRQDVWRRRVASSVANRVRRMFLGDPFTDIGCSLTVYRTRFIRDLPWFDGMHRFVRIFALRRGARWKELPVRHRPRIHGESKYNISGRLVRGLRDLFVVRNLLRSDERS